MYICTMEYYTSIRKNEILPFKTSEMDLEGIMLSEVRKRRNVLFLKVMQPV